MESLYKDQIKPHYIIIAVYLGRIFRLAITFLLLAYFIGLLWYFNCTTLQDAFMGNNKDAFYDIGRDWRNDIGFIESSQTNRIFVSSYFSLTTLSTVGFGDLYPQTDFERITGSFIILGGLLCFSYVN